MLSLCSRNGNVLAVLPDGNTDQKKVFPGGNKIFLLLGNNALCVESNLKLFVFCAETFRCFTQGLEASQSCSS